MGVVYARIDDELEKRFRVKVAEKYGGERGALSKSVKEALKLWLTHEESTEDDCMSMPDNLHVKSILEKMPGWMIRDFHDEGIPKDFMWQDLTEKQKKSFIVSHTIRGLEEKGLVDVKYFDDKGLCVRLTEKGDMIK